MEKFGWKKSMGLGKDLRGNPNPITIVEKKSFDPNYASEEENETDDEGKQPSFKWISCNNRPVKIVNFVKLLNKITCVTSSSTSSLLFLMFFIMMLL